LSCGIFSLVVFVLVAITIWCPCNCGALLVISSNTEGRRLRSVFEDIDLELFQATVDLYLSEMIALSECLLTDLLAVVYLYILVIYWIQFNSSTIFFNTFALHVITFFNRRSSR
jgi:hypothetical protein